METKLLKTATIFADKRSNLPVLTTLCFSNGSIHATNLDASIKLYHHDNSLNGCFSANSIAVSMPKTLAAAVHQPNGKLVIEGVPLERFMEVEDFPMMETLPAVSSTAYDLHPLLFELAPFCSTDESRFNMNSVYYDYAEKALVATDGHRLLKIDYEIQGLDHDVLIHSVGIFKLEKALKTLKPSTTGIRFTEKTMEAVMYNDDSKAIGYITLRLGESAYPNWERVTPETSRSVDIPFNEAKKFCEHADRLNKSFSDYRKKTWMCVHLRANSEELVVSHYNKRGTKNKFTEIIKLNGCNLNEFELYINYSYLLDYIKLFKHCNFELPVSVGEPITFKGINKLGIIMPMRP